MVFNEIYSVYYRAVAGIIDLAVNGELTEKSMRAVIDKTAFSESFFEIIPAIKQEKWKLICSDFSTPLKHRTSVPLTQLQLQWLKAISLDKRMQLFDLNFDFLNNTEALFMPDDCCFFDRYCDGDPFDDKKYKKHFRIVLDAIKQHKKVILSYRSVKGLFSEFSCYPYRLEYSEKDDKFRVYIHSSHFADTIYLSCIEKCEMTTEQCCHSITRKKTYERYFVVRLCDDRNSLERFLMHFSHFKKEAVQISDSIYEIKIYYDINDETELVIRVLSFGPFIKVISPQRFTELIKNRLILQKSCAPL